MKNNDFKKFVFLPEQPDHVLISKNGLIPEVRRTIKKCENTKVKVVYLYPFVVFNGLIINH